MAYFIGGQVFLHLAMGALAWLCARATLALWPSLRPKFVRIVVGWFSLLGGAALAYNALWYPRTFFGAHYHDSMVARLGPLHVGQWIYGSVSIAAALVLLAAGVHACRRMHAGRRRRWAVAAATVFALACAAVLVDRFDVFSRVHASKQPNVILLGIDSLRLEELERFGGKAGRLAHVDEFLKEADLVRDASTPMPRTFGSWVSILSGRSPAVTGARNNLTPGDEVVPNPTIADVLRQHGYQTIYSTDEVRFANIDESYGFDKVITPPIGASDFIIGTYNELPLPSVIINTRLGQLLFPFSYGNRGAATVFEPATYLGRLDREIQFDRPTFLIIHLTAAHWPYYTAETPFGMAVKKYPDDRPMYRVGLRTVDAMFGQVVSMLRRKGALDNAIVVTLSDHGEALALPNDSFMKNGAFVKGLGSPIKVLDVGHGQSVLSPTQYKILLGFRSFAQAGGFCRAGTGSAAARGHRRHRANPPGSARHRRLAAAVERPVARAGASFQGSARAACRTRANSIHRDRPRGDPGAGRRRGRSKHRQGGLEFLRHRSRFEPDLYPAQDAAAGARLQGTRRVHFATPARGTARRAGCAPVRLLRHRLRQR